MSTESRSTAVRRRATLVVALIGLVSLPAAPALAQPGNIERADPVVDVAANGERIKVAGATVNVSGSAAEVRAAGATVTVRGDVAGDVRAAGAKVDIDATVGRDIKVGGAAVEVRGRVGNDAAVGGAVVTVNAVVGGRLRVGGATVTIGPGSDIGGGLQGGGASFRVSGHIAGPVQIGGGLVTFNARADGSVEISGGRVVINAPARIGGDLIVRSRSAPEIDPGAVIAGEVRRLEPPRWWWPISPAARAAAFAAFAAAGTIVAGVILMLFGGRVFATATDHVRLRPGSSFLIGLATAVLVPAIAAALVATVIGLTAGVAILLIMPLLIVFGHAVAAAGIASGIFVRGHGELGTGRAFVLLIVGAIVIALIWLIPWVGPALAGIILLFGIGALARTLGSRIRRAGAAAA